MSVASRRGERIHEALLLLEGCAAAAERSGWDERRAERAGLIVALQWLGFSHHEATEAAKDLCGEAPDDGRPCGTLGVERPDGGQDRPGSQRPVPDAPIHRANGRTRAEVDPVPAGVDRSVGAGAGSPSRRGAGKSGRG